MQALKSRRMVVLLSGVIAGVMSLVGVLTARASVPATQIDAPIEASR